MQTFEECLQGVARPDRVQIDVPWVRQRPVADVCVAIDSPLLLNEQPEELGSERRFLHLRPVQWVPPVDAVRVAECD